MEITWQTNWHSERVQTQPVPQYRATQTTIASNPHPNTTATKDWATFSDQARKREATEQTPLATRLPAVERAIRVMVNDALSALLHQPVGQQNEPG